MKKLLLSILNFLETGARNGCRTILARGGGEVRAAALGAALGLLAVAQARDVYYLSAQGDDAADGRSPGTAWRTTAKVNASLPGGAEIRLRRGDVFYGQLHLKSGPDAAHPTVVDAWGEGARPEISLYKIAKPDPSVWESLGGNVWRIDLHNASSCTGNPAANGNIGFLLVDGVIHGVKRFDNATLKAPWEFEDDWRFLRVYSEKNPAEVSKDIRFAPCIGGIPFVRNAEVHSVVVRGTGAHGSNGVGRDMLFRDCVFREIGGSELGRGKPGHHVRYGNGVECWAGSTRIRVEKCEFYDTYDVAFTMQGPNPSCSWEDVHVTDCTIVRCTQAIELWATQCKPGIGFKRCSFERNRCVDTGYCWGYDVRPNKDCSAPLLMYGMDATVCDVLVKDNVFENTRLSLVHKSGGVGDLPDDYRIVGNVIRNKHPIPVGNRWYKRNALADAAREAPIRAANTFDPPATPPPPPDKLVLCWGDSITEGMGMPRGKDYPSQLEALLGKGWSVLNSGDGGEDAVTIPARQGGLSLVTAAPIVFPDGEKTVTIGSAADNGFRTPDGARISLTQPLGRQIPVNPVTIGNVTYRLALPDFRWNSPTNRISYTLTLSRGRGLGKLEIPAGTPVRFASTVYAPQAACEIFFIGANGGWNNDVNQLIARYRAMIARRGENAPYLVIMPYWGGFSEANKQAFRAAFGRHVVEFQPTTEFCYRNRPDVHLNEQGYARLAQLLHARGRELGYW